MKPILMIHEFKEEYLDLPLKNYILSFDDGLVSQYLLLPEVLKLDTIKIFSISTGVICNTTPSFEFIDCFEARKKANKGNFENYMTWGMIKKIYEQKNCIISGHSHSHIRLNSFKILNDKIEYIKKDTDKMFEVFKEKLNHIPNIFCFPFNDDNLFYKGILETKYNIKQFLGKERIPIENLL